MDAKQTNQTFDLVGYIEPLVALHKEGAYFIGACPICGGRDRFNIKRTNSGDAWICRRCGDGKYHSALDFLMAYHKENFIDALKRAGGEVQAPRRELGRGKPVIAPAPVQVLPSDEWQNQARHFLTVASDRLMDEPEGEPARQYLASRGISLGSMARHLLGFAVIGTRPAIVIPWLDIGDVVTSVKYRYIDDLARADKRRRFTAMDGSMPYLFGLQHILKSDKSLLFVEGELNAISVLQTQPRGVSVVSGGSDGNGNAALLKALARHYNRVVIWTDDPAKGKTIRERMNRPEARILKSPMIDGVKYDANQMLQNGLLMEFISGEFFTQCLGVPVDTTITAYMAATVAA
jgi:primase-helicase-like zinc-binding protein